MFQDEYRREQEDVHADEAPGSTMLADGQSTTSCWGDLMPTRITVNPWLLRDYCFDISRSELLNGYEEWQLWAVSLKSTDLPDNSARLTFTLGE